LNPPYKDIYSPWFVNKQSPFIKMLEDPILQKGIGIVSLAKGGGGEEEREKRKLKSLQVVE